MAVVDDDNHRPRRSKILSDHEARDNTATMTEDLRRFIFGKHEILKSLPRERCLAKIDLDNHCDFSPEGYLESGAVRVDPSHRVISARAAQRQTELVEPPPLKNYPVGLFPLKRFIDQEVAPPLKTLKAYPRGGVPVISATSQNNGVAEWLSVPKEHCLEKCLTISKVHNTKPCEAFWHPYRFSAINTVFVLRPIELLRTNPEAIFYLCESITANNAWRYQYARPVRLHEIGGLCARNT